MPKPFGSSSPAPDLTRHRQPLDALTGVRFLAAFYVVLFHGLPWIERKHALPGLLHIFFSNGYLAVDLFFILSGVILAYTYKGQIEGKQNRLHFWEARFARIYPVYWLSLFLAFWFERGLPFTTRILVLLMVQAWNPRAPQLTGAWNYPAWTLSVEGFFYLCFPFLLPRMGRWSDRSLTAAFILFLSICVVAHTPVLGLGIIDSRSVLAKIVPLPILRIPEFLLGITLSLKFLRQERPVELRTRSIRVTFAILSALLILSLPLGAWVSLVAVPFAILVYELAVGNNWLATFLSTRLMVLLGGASYAVYLLQFPVRSWVRVFFSHLPEALASFSQVLTPLILVLFSILVFKFWEEPSRKALRSWFAKFKSATPEVSIIESRGRSQ
jgi:peptidoglycan/LPS O-acetylase OafA/YrhL